MTGWLEQTERVILKLGNENRPTAEIKGVVEVSGLSCDENVITSQMVGSSLSLVQRSYRKPYAFSITMYILKQDAGTAMSQIESLRQDMLPLDISIIRTSAEPTGDMMSQWVNNMTGNIFQSTEIMEEDILGKYGISQVNLVSFSASEEQDLITLDLSMEEYIVYDGDNILIEPEQYVIESALDELENPEGDDTANGDANTSGDQTENTAGNWLSDIGDV